MNNENLEAKSNIANKVRNTKLPKTRSLMPLFELVSNSIHAINEARKLNILNNNGKIKIDLIRNGDENVLKELSEIDNYPINSIRVTDNGIGLNDENLNCFIETDTDHKIAMGGKGVGRFVCLKAFRKLIVKSRFTIDGDCVLREFEFKATKEGFHEYSQKIEASMKTLGTQILLSGIREEYSKTLPKTLMDVSRAVINHFLLYFLENDAPNIIVTNQNAIEVNLNALFQTDFKQDVDEKEFFVGDQKLKLFLTKSFNILSHKLHFCAHNRSVREEGLSNRLIDLGKYSIKSSEGNFYYQAFVVGDILDENVDVERVGFNFPNDDDEAESKDEITLSKIRNAAILCIEDLLSVYLNNVREEKIERYKPTIMDELPQYRSTLNYRLDEVKRLPPDLTPQKLDIELYRIESNWKIEVKETGHQLIEEKVDITNLEEYKIRYEKFLTEFNELGKSDLARYIVHRKSVIELLEELLGENAKKNFSNEDIIHSVFFPIRSSSDEIPHNKQNLWLIDERLTYHSFLASDRTFENIKSIESDSENRSDMLIFNDAIAFSETNLPPFNSFTIVEFKKPQRDNYIDNDPKKNPLDQVELYITDLLNGKVKNRKGRIIKIDPNMPFYVYIICDITKSFEKILINREFIKTTDGVGFFKMKSQYYSAYIEVLPFEKVLFDAKKRNRILFERLGLSTINN